jgi:hypothetical protein
VRRILTVLTVALVMAALVVAMAVPAFANHGEPHGKAYASPPAYSGDLESGGDQGKENQGNGAVVLHCQADPGPNQGPGSSVTVVGPSGETRGGGDPETCR